jgi:hypothetical protein
MNGMPNIVNKTVGSITSNFLRSANPVDRVSEDFYSK